MKFKKQEFIKHFQKECFKFKNKIKDFEKTFRKLFKIISTFRYIFNIFKKHRFFDWKILLKFNIYLISKW